MNVYRKFIRPYLRRLLLPAFLIAAIASLLPACGRQNSIGRSARANGSDQSGIYKVYYINKEGTTITATDFDGSKWTGEELCRQLIAQLGTAPDSVEYKAPVDGFTCNSVTLDGTLVTVDFSVEYLQMDSIRETLTRAAVVNTLCEVDGVTAVQITVEGSPLTDGEGDTVGSMTRDMFIFNSGNEIRNYTKTRLHLYFANDSGDRLISTYRTIVYNSNISQERLVVEQVLSGPKTENVKPTLNPDTKVLSVTNSNGTCYVNLDGSFLVEPYDVTPQVALYSLVNSLAELTSVNQVQISVNGDVNVKFMDFLDLQNTFDKNADIIEK